MRAIVNSIVVEGRNMRKRLISVLYCGVGL